MKTPTLDQSTLNCVRADLVVAVSHGYNPVGMTDAEIAGDMIAYEDTYASWSIEQLTPYVAAVRQSLGTNGTVQ
jgi:hypothetical protein